MTVTSLLTDTVGNIAFLRGHQKSSGCCQKMMPKGTTRREGCWCPSLAGAVDTATPGALGRLQSQLSSCGSLTLKQCPSQWPWLQFCSFLCGLQGLCFPPHTRRKSFFIWRGNFTFLRLSLLLHGWGFGKQRWDNFSFYSSFLNKSVKAYLGLPGRLGLYLPHATLPHLRCFLPGL